MANNTLIWLEGATALRPDDPAMRRLDVLEPRAAAPLYPQESNPGKDWWRGVPEGRLELADPPGEGGRFGPGAGAPRDGCGTIDDPSSRLRGLQQFGRGSTPEGWNMGVPFLRFGVGQVGNVTSEGAAKEAERKAEQERLRAEIEELIRRQLREEQDFIRLLNMGLSFDDAEHLTGVQERDEAIQKKIEKLEELQHGLRLQGTPGHEEAYRSWRLAEVWQEMLAGPRSPGGGLVDPPAQISSRGRVSHLEARSITPHEGGNSPSVSHTLFRPGDDRANFAESVTRYARLSPRVQAWLTLPDPVDRRTR